METNENLTEKLEFIGLDFNNIPDRLNYFHSINFGVHKNYIEENYKVYKYINVNDIDIFLSPTNRLTDYTEKYAKALPIAAYLSTNTDEEMEKNVEFLNMLKDVSIEEIQELENQQEAFKKEIPYTTQFSEDYIWQIHYSDSSKKYFMLTPTRETEKTAMFYLLKKQLEDKNEKIYVPICYADYSRKYLSPDEFDEIEKYLCFFAKDWPQIYEVFDNDDNLRINITGKATIYDSLKSEYKIELKTQGDAENFYKLLKALFILETQIAQYYKFKVKIDKHGNIHFMFNDKEIDYEELIPFVKDEYIKGVEKLIKEKEKKINLEKELKKLKEYNRSLDNEYHEKEKQISTFLECKKSFFGRVKYFIKYKKTKLHTVNSKPADKEETGTFKYFEKADIKDVYTIEELLELYTNLEKEVSSVKDYESDIDAINKRIDIMKTKLENAVKYIKEIDAHKKSIFDFWKFTNKDNEKQLNAGVEEIHTSKKLKKVFNYELDFEDLSKKIDKTQRDVFNKDETDNIFLATTEVIEDLNLIANNLEIPDDHLQRLKDKMTETGTIVTFDIFGSATSSNEQIKTLGNIRHRESEKNKFAVLNLNVNTSLEEYTNRVKKAYASIIESYKKITNSIEIPIYKAGEIDDGLNIFYINPENAIKNLEGKETKLNKIILKENANCIALTNIMYYNNTNQTLPLGMNIIDGILIDTKVLELKQTNKDSNYIIRINKELLKPESLKINIHEYEIC